MTTCDFFHLTPAEQVDYARRQQWRTHRGPSDWGHDIAQSNERALQVITALRNGTPRPVFGRRNARNTDA